MPSEELQILSAEIHRPGPVSEAKATPSAQELLPQAEATPPAVQEPVLSVEVNNPSDKSLHVWSSRRAYDYDSATHVLTLYLTEHAPPTPPGIKMISDHPRTPIQIEVKPKSRGTIDVHLPAVIRRQTASKGLGMAFIEEPIGQIERVDIHFQYADEPLHNIPHESPEEHRSRLRAHGRVARATLTPTEKKEQ